MRHPVDAARNIILAALDTLTAEEMKAILNAVKGRYHARCGEIYGRTGICPGCGKKSTWHQENGESK